MRSAADPHRPSLRRWLLLAASLALVLPAAAVADDGAGSEARGIDRACLGDTAQVERFDDVSSDVHTPAINCLGVYGITQGTGIDDGVRRYTPDGAVSRQQMASFLQRSLGHTRTSPLTDPPDDAVEVFDDHEDISEAHRLAVGQLAEAAIVEGREDGTFDPTADITRAQVASFAVRTIEAVTGNTLPRDASFDDVDGTHAANVEKLATVGVLEGTGPGTFEPWEPLTRAQMASVIARSLDYLAEVDALFGLDHTPPEGTLLGLTDLSSETLDDRDRIVFELQGDDAPAGWWARYVDEPREQGTGDLVEVAGDKVLQLDLVSMGLPFDLPEEVNERREQLDFTRVDVDGEVVVEIVNNSIFEGHKRIFIGTTDAHPFTIEQAGTDPQTVTVDVAHP